MSEGSASLPQRATQLYEVWNAQGIDAVAERFWAEQIEWRDDPSVPDAGSYRGRTQVRKHIKDRVEVLGHFRIDLERASDGGAGRVLVIYVVGGKGGRSGAPWQIRMAQLLQFEGDRVVVVQDFLDVDRALEAAGLSQ